MKSLNAEFVERGLTVEQHNVIIPQVSFHDIPKLEILCHLCSVAVTQEPGRKENQSINMSL